jgi:DNA-binding response OmpR family regulator
MRLLIVEDDAMLADGLARSLRQSGYAVDWVDSAERAQLAVEHETFDLVVLDVGLPGIDGFELLRRLRQAEQYVPVIVVTARDAVSDRVRGLDLGADDYLVKPFAFEELEARVRALIRRGRTPKCGGFPGYFLLDRPRAPHPRAACLEALSQAPHPALPPWARRVARNPLIRLYSRAFQFRSCDADRPRQGKRALRGGPAPLQAHRREDGPPHRAARPGVLREADPGAETQARRGDQASLQAAPQPDAPAEALLGSRLSPIEAPDAPAYRRFAFLDPPAFPP